jgi:hypothetical protein
LRYDKCLIIHGDCNGIDYELRLYTTSRKVTGSDIDEIIEFLSIYLILPGRIMALGLTHPVTEMSTANITRG